MKILVADETLAWVKLIVRMLRNNFTSMTLVGVARSGKDCIEKALHLHPDIIILDVQMQGIDGIEAIRQIQCEAPHIQYIIFSELNSFEYAIQAIELGVSGYLIKPIKEERFVETVRHCMKQCEEQQALQHRYLQQQEQLEMVLPCLEMGLIHGLVLLNVGGAQLKQYCHMLGHVDRYFSVMVVEFVSKNQYLSPTQPQQYHTFHGEFKRILQSFCDCVVGPMMRNRLVVVIFDDSTSEEDRIKQVIEIAYHFKRRIRSYHSDIYIGIGGCYASIEQGQQSYQEALQALQFVRQQQMTDKGEGLQQIESFALTGTESKEGITEMFTRIAHVNDIPSQDAELIDLAEQTAQLMSFMQQLDQLGTQEHFEQLYQLLLEKDKTLTVISNHMIAIVVSVCKTWDLFLMETGLIVQKIVQCKSVESLFDFMQNWFSQIIQQYKQHHQDRVSSIIETVNRYLEECYAESISLDQVAKKVNLSVYYFSRYYKQQSGINFREKLTRVRIEKAKELLRKQEISVKDICYLVGYSDPTYFSKLFKKQTGYTPGEYKKIL